MVDIYIYRGTIGNSWYTTTINTGNNSTNIITNISNNDGIADAYESV